MKPMVDPFQSMHVCNQQSLNSYEQTLLFKGQVSGKDLTDLSSLFEHLLSHDEHNVHHMVNINIGCKVIMSLN